jgi:ABC-type branched-subunit amino acid transport system permease subunit
VVAKVEWHPGELYPRVGFIVTNLRRLAERVVAFYNQRGTAEQWIKEGKNAVKWTRLSCRRFRHNAVRLQLHALAYNLANFMRTLDSGRIGIEGVVVWSAHDFWVMTIGWSVVALSCVVIWLLMRSPWGRVLKAIREDEDAVRSLGKNVYAYKMQALMIGGMFGALAGVFTALRSASIGPSFFATDGTFFAWTVLLIGGAARVLGPVAGAVIFWFLISALGSFFSQATSGADPLIPASIMTSTQASLMRFIFLGLGLMLLMIFRPQGIFGDRKELALDTR